MIRFLETQSTLDFVSSAFLPEVRFILHDNEIITNTKYKFIQHKNDTQNKEFDQICVTYNIAKL